MYRSLRFSMPGRHISFDLVTSYFLFSTQESKKTHILVWTFYITIIIYFPQMTINFSEFRSEIGIFLLFFGFGMLFWFRIAESVSEISNNLSPFGFAGSFNMLLLKRKEVYFQLFPYQNKFLFLKAICFKKTIIFCATL